MSLLGAALDLVLPRYCAGCERPGRSLCPACAAPGRAGRVAVPGLTVGAAGGYEGGLRRALLAYKERGRHELARDLAGLLAGAIRVAGVDDPAAACLVPVPSSPRAARERGGDHVLRLARGAGRATGLPVVPVLALGRGVRDSAGLDRAARAANLAGAFVATGPAAGRRAVVVDDIVTTGATLREAARALRSAGWPVPVAAVIAATPRAATAPRQRSPGTSTNRELA